MKINRYWIAAAILGAFLIGKHAHAEDRSQYPVHGMTMVCGDWSFDISFGTNDVQINRPHRITSYDIDDPSNDHFTFGPYTMKFNDDGSKAVLTVEGQKRRCVQQ